VAALYSLNPALEDVRFCPRCATEAEVRFPRSLTCGDCGYSALWSPEPVAATIPRDDDGRIWLLRRAHHEGAGRWTFPGGFVELGETVEDAAYRETREELEIEIELGALVGRLLAHAGPGRASPVFRGWWWHGLVVVARAVGC
jgi:NADH pyrophosphatase NudC (nudix superfamily)